MKVDAAEGFHMLGMYADAADEIAGIDGQKQSDLDALHVRARAYWALRDIPKALASINRFIEVAPDLPFGYVFKAMLLSYERKPRDAYALLRSVISKFPEHATMHYDLACAAAECGIKSEACHWLYVAISCQPSLKQLALDLEAFADIKNDIERMNPEH